MKNDVPELSVDDVDPDDDLDEDEEQEEQRPVYMPWASSSVGDRDYWRSAPHPFAPTRWGPAYCLMCTATETGEGVEHLNEANLPFSHPWRLGVHETPSPGHRPASAWHVEAWNETGGGCSYEVDRAGREASLARAQRYAENGDETGRRYDHYAVKETVYTVLATQFIHPVPSTEPAAGA